VSENSWQPSCDLTQLQNRAQMLMLIRHFFAEKNVLEVETPLLCQSTGTDPQLDFFTSSYQQPPFEKKLFLQTSPEFAMKRLLVAGSGSIYQICKAFRNGEQGRFHNPEFTLLEWYRVGFNLDQLMDEVATLINIILKSHQVIKKISYQTLFFQKTGLNPLQYQPQLYKEYALSHAIPEAISLCEHNHDLWLDFIFSHHIQPTLIGEQIYLVHSYPASQASLARINTNNPAIADRFEVFVNGIELGNGFFELADESEQTLRFEQEIIVRKINNRPSVSKDWRFLAALKAGLPNCCGVAIGLDRLLMLMTSSTAIDEVLAFPLDRA